MNKTKWIIFTLVVIGIFGSVILLSKSNNGPDFKGDAAKIITDGPIADHVFGTRDQKVVLIEYGDMQCPACKVMHQPIKDLTTKYKNQVTFIFRHYPLTNIHPNALASATATEAAGLQGKYWEMHDKLYETQSEWSTVSIEQRENVFADYASQLGMNTEQFKRDLASSQIADKINRDRNIGRQTYGLEGTPSFILNGTPITGTDAVKTDLLTQKVEDAIKTAYGKLEPTTIPGTTTP
jgi:protein-disulfide isomerase